MTRLLSLNAVVALFLLLASSGVSGDTPRGEPVEAGTLPTDARGRPLNLDFETGTLADWTAEGDAFRGQPIEGDTVHRRRGDMHSRHAGRFWVGTYERGGDPPKGTLTSVPFRVTKPFASFLVGGGSHARTCVELVRKDTGKVVFRASGDDTEDMERVVVDLIGAPGPGDRDPAGGPTRRSAGATSTSTTSGCTTRGRPSRPGGGPRPSTSTHTPASRPRRPRGR